MKITTSFFLILLSLGIQAQNIAPSMKLQAAISAGLVKANEKETAFLNFFCEKGFKIQQKGKEGVSYPLLSSVLNKKYAAAVDYKTLSESTFNPLMVVNRNRAQTSGYQIDGTDKIVQILPEDYVHVLFQDQLNNQKNKTNAKK
jgi:hypothetical protein